VFILGVDGWRAVNQTGQEVPVYSDTGSYIYVQSLPGQDLTFEAPGKELFSILYHLKICDTFQLVIWVIVLCLTINC
jgi:hypothetical protein